MKCRQLILMYKIKSINRSHKKQQNVQNKINQLVTYKKQQNVENEINQSFEYKNNKTSKIKSIDWSLQKKTTMFSIKIQSNYKNKTQLQ
mmetsp:Transcript_59349/g.70786  ORF Transcript_59349/g.70786 Transcript_59349/m.70786 type:complete len:89 (+) Transcript_59349:1680-1946(+)